jgi:hypothetical protein
MSRMRRTRRWMRLGPWTALLLGTGCGGGGDKAPTGPGGEDTAQLELVSIGKVGLPADVQPEDCNLTRIYGGQLQVTDDGSWVLRLQVHDDIDGDWLYGDQGEVEEDGANLWFHSGYSGSSYAADVNGSEIRIMYDWCYDGVPDIQLVLDR